MRERLRLGAIPQDGGVRFRVWAPEARRVDLVVEPAGADRAMSRDADGYFELFVPALPAGVLYRYRVDDGPAYPDPASRFQPQGVHGPSLVVDADAFGWRDQGWAGVEQRDLVFYELHVGTFTPEGTFQGARRRLPFLRELGITAVEVMPVAEFPGRWNWGYDQGACFAPSRAYGTPDDFRAFVDDAHGMGIAVVLDVIYNHFGPDGAYAPAVSRQFFSSTRTTPWGPAINFDGTGARAVRGFCVENALHWLHEYHLDGLRLDATHSIMDDSAVHILRELAEAVHAMPGRKRYLIAEDHRNLNRLVLPAGRGGYGLDGVWSDDYHHELRRMLVGDRDGYFGDFAGTTRDLAVTIRQGWLFSGQHAPYFRGPRGTDPADIPLHGFVHFFQNHDQVGNRPGGDRLSTRIPWHTYRALSALLLFSPELPLLFMGQEWGARTPFYYFTDHHPELGRLVREGRRREFRRFADFAGDVPDPQAADTFERSRLDWDEAARAPHAGVLRLHRDLLVARRGLGGEFSVESPVEGGLLLRRGPTVLAVALADEVVMPWPDRATPAWSTEQVEYGAEPMPPRIEAGQISFARAAALRGRLDRP